METYKQLVSRYIGGLHEQIQDAWNLMDIYSVSETYQGALQLEKQMKKMNSNGGWNSSSWAGAQVAAKPAIT